MITRIRNAVTAKHTRVDMPASKLKAEIARIEAVLVIIDPIVLHTKKFIK